MTSTQTTQNDDLIWLEKDPPASTEMYKCGKLHPYWQIAEELVPQWPGAICGCRKLHTGCDQISRLMCVLRTCATLFKYRNLKDSTAVAMAEANIRDEDWAEYRCLRFNRLLRMSTRLSRREEELMVYGDRANSCRPRH